jgi:hypothetical protein
VSLTNITLRLWTDTGSSPLEMEHIPKPDIETPATATKRIRELYKYFVPPGSAFSASRSTLPQSILAAHVQLVAWRMNTRRALVSLIDRDRQYFVAESSKTLNLEDRYFARSMRLEEGSDGLSVQSDDPADAIWAGASQILL